ncbi:MAG: hypothetical protein HN390_10440 [Anaerolineae bacterium]|nr:hypothetical protein [Anaerolineae bacterium]MBT7189627.1 hypothetical protein [Anaerolineae bacterium]MBT7991845.1 hypothetical protein [Anaerolineae bacterium]
MDEILHQPGFFGTSANFAADFTLVMMILIASLFTVGVVLAVKKKYDTHRWVQTAAAILNAIMVLWMMVLPYRDFVAPGIPAQLAERFHAITTLHAFVGFFALTFGLFVTLRGNGLVPKALKFKNYKAFMRVAYGLYMLTTILGIWVYSTWFVGNPNPPTY